MKKEKWLAMVKKGLMACLVGFFLVTACKTVPVTGRHQLLLMNDSEMLSMSFQNYDEFLDENPLSKDQANSKMVKEVGERIRQAVDRYFQEKGQSEMLKDYDWEFNLVESDVPNAWCMPGGKVVVYSGILPFTKNETGLAVVMGHEIAHAIARHGNERMSQQLLVNLGGVALSQAVNEKPDQTKAIYMGLYGIGSNVGVMLPYSRKHEYEADHMGLIFMAMAGYDPSEAVAFWQRMGQSGGQKPPEFLSTHPADESRIEALQELLPEAMKYYKPE